MPRYLVQRVFLEGLPAHLTAAAAGTDDRIVATNADLGVTWLHSYVSADQQTLLCLYEGPDPESIRKAATRNDLPIETITQVAILDPHGYR
jgi:Nickel responsive protein SCO4226-like